jgi:hypothetical protein
MVKDDTIPGFDLERGASIRKQFSRARKKNPAWGNKTIKYVDQFFPGFIIEVDDHVPAEDAFIAVQGRDNRQNVAAGKAGDGTDPVTDAIVGPFLMEGSPQKILGNTANGALSINTGASLFNLAERKVDPCQPEILQPARFHGHEGEGIDLFAGRASHRQNADRIGPDGRTGGKEEKKRSRPG